MKAYKITGKLGDICSFVGGTEVKKGDMVYLHSESDIKQQCVAEPQEKQRQWVGLTEEDKEAIYEEYVSSPQSFMEITEAKLKEKNT